MCRCCPLKCFGDLLIVPKAFCLCSNANFLLVKHNPPSTASAGEPGACFHSEGWLTLAPVPPRGYPPLIWHFNNCRHNTSTPIFPQRSDFFFFFYNSFFTSTLDWAAADQPSPSSFPANPRLSDTLFPPLRVAQKNTFQLDLCVFSPLVWLEGCVSCLKYKDNYCKLKLNYIYWFSFRLRWVVILSFIIYFDFHWSECTNWLYKTSCCATVSKMGLECGWCYAHVLWLDLYHRSSVPSLCMETSNTYLSTLLRCFHICHYSQRTYWYFSVLHPHYCSFWGFFLLFHPNFPFGIQMQFQKGCWARR